MNILLILKNNKTIKRDKLMKKYFNFDTTYTSLDASLYSYVKPVSVKAPSVFLFNKKLAESLGVLDGASEEEIAEILSGNKIAEGSEPFSQAYCGHQYGYLNELGDGRAIHLGEHISPNNDRMDIQLKGAGKTPYARNGDGRATLASMIREYLISEAMHYLGIKGTRSLAVVKTGEEVFRTEKNDGGVLTRVASSHIRVGTIQYAALKHDDRLLKDLVDHSINRHYPSIKYKEDKYLAFFKEVIKAQISLVTEWMRVGFVHGVLNTDNVSICGESIDFGPCAFMDSYNSSTVFSSIDLYGRYSYGNQPSITGWNMARLGEALIGAISDSSNGGDEEALKKINAELSGFLTSYDASYKKMLGHKIGFYSLEEDDVEFIGVLFNMMELFAFDYTNTFVYLRHLIQATNIDPEILMPEDEEARKLLAVWVEEWKNRLDKKGESTARILALMEANNPIVIPRNHLVEEAIKSATSGNLDKLDKLLEVLSKPYDYSFSESYYILPSDDEKPFVTYCGT